MTTTKLAIEGGDPAVTCGPPSRWPDITDADKAEVLAVLDGPPGDLGGPHSRWNRDLEGDFAAFVGARHCVSLPSATAALYASLLVHGIGPGDEVIVPALTWVATPMVVANLGATPVFCDIDPVTYNLDPAKARGLITPATRAIIAVHAHGLPADMSALLDICRQHGLYLIEDAAQAAGATYAGQSIGTLGATGCFSLNVKKPLTAGDGGLLVTDDPDLLVAVVSWTNFGLDADRPPLPGETASHWSRWLGTNDRLSPMTAALARSQLRRLPQFLERAEANAALLAQIDEIAGLRSPVVPDDRDGTHHLYRVMIDPEAYGWDGSPTELRDRVIWALDAEGVPAGHWGLEPLDRMPAFRRAVPTARTIGGSDGELRPWNPKALPVTRNVLDSSFVLGRAPETLQIVDAERVRQWVTAFNKVSERMEVVLDSPDFTPLSRHPRVSELEA